MDESVTSTGTLQPDGGTTYDKVEVLSMLFNKITSAEEFL